MNKKISFVYFDLGRVVVDNNAAHTRISKETGMSPSAVEDFFVRTEGPPGRGEISSRAYMAQVKKGLDKDYPYEDFADFWSDYLEPIPQTHVLIRELAPLYKLGILSNAEEGCIEQHIKKGKVPAVSWAAIIESAQVHCVKPEKEIFEIAQKSAKVPAAEIFFIDDKEENVRAAQDMGWQAQLFYSSDIEGSLAKLRQKLLPKT